MVTIGVHVPSGPRPSPWPLSSGSPSGRPSPFPGQVQCPERRRPAIPFPGGRKGEATGNRAAPRAAVPGKIPAWSGFPTTNRPLSMLTTTRSITCYVVFVNAALRLRPLQADMNRSGARRSSDDPPVGYERREQRARCLSIELTCACRPSLLSPRTFGFRPRNSPSGPGVPPDGTRPGPARSGLHQPGSLRFTSLWAR